MLKPRLKRKERRKEERKDFGRFKNNTIDVYYFKAL